jgi:hypothetical protein
MNNIDRRSIRGPSMKHLPTIRKRQREAHPRRGAAIVEGAFVLSVLLTVLFGMFDVGLAVLRQNTLAEAVRVLARSAIVHGALANSQVGAWGAGTISTTAADASPAASVVKPLLVTMNPSAVSLSLQWLDGDNQPGHRVVAKLSYQHQPMIPFILGSAPINLSATSTMRIAH